MVSTLSSSRACCKLLAAALLLLNLFCAALSSTCISQVREGTWYNGIDSNGYLRRRTATQCEQQQ